MRVFSEKYQEDLLNEDYVKVYHGPELDDNPIIKGQIADPGPENLRIFQQRYLPAIQQSKVPKDRLRILELGSGFGRLTQPFLQQLNPEFYMATEPFRSLCRVLRHNLDDWGHPRPHGWVGLYDANYPLELNEGFINLVIGNNVLHHILDYSSCISHLVKVLNSPGTIIFVEPVLEAWIYWITLIRAALNHCEVSGSSLKLSEQTTSILQRHISNLEIRLKHRGDPESLSSLDDKHIFSIPKLQEIAHQHQLHFNFYRTAHRWSDTARFRLQQLSITPTDQSSLLSFFEIIRPEGMEDTLMKDFALTLCFNKV